MSLKKDLREEEYFRRKEIEDLYRRLHSMTDYLQKKVTLLYEYLNVIEEFTPSETKLVKRRK